MRELIALVLFGTITTTNAGWFNKGEDLKREREQRIQTEAQRQALEQQQHVLEAQKAATEKQLMQNQHAAMRFQTIALVLGIACPILLGVGAALGASTRRHGKPKE